MRFNGILSSWNDERGFGYIESTQGGEPIFVHISSWPRNIGRPELNQTVSFEVEVGAKGKRAKHVQLLRVRQVTKMSERAERAQWGVATLFTIPAFLVLYLIVASIWKTPIWIAGLYVAASVATFIAYAADKSAATNGSRRTPESSLHALAVVGGWPGALLAQQFLRHKTTKQEFRQSFWVTVIVNVIVFVVLASTLWPAFRAAQ